MPKSVVSIRLEQRQLDELDRLSGDCLITRSHLVERILSLFLEQDRVSQNRALGRREASR